ncbi:acetyl-CoA carboxylase biotin carboxyl carrier protein [Novosphingobium colocasiae]|uniref:acetyl-CoA carboxylase biotin carboxyl carrier protein n=1 Tax=Novosphingobium colocasiae TaxID=1256513 RepID=UPI0035B2ACC0
MTDKCADLPANLEALLAEFAASGVRELHLRRGDFEIFLSSDASARWSAPAPVAAAAPPAAAPVQALAPTMVAPATPAAAVPVQRAASGPVPADALIIHAPNLGTFYRAPKPGAANYVEVGSKVKAGDELCLIEVMKLFTALTAETSGTIHSVLVDDGEMVEGGQPLFALVRD